ncbi:tetratricopeptide repeat protein [Streptomyces sp. NPDC058701]|uniref:tetratricopeptide repeat protein n=1 Tax=Streptomyces sp. NPDC058701 TaxID=3346608 RepID=UPI00364A7469
MATQPDTAIGHRRLDELLSGASRAREAGDSAGACRLLEKALTLAEPLGPFAIARVRMGEVLHAQSLGDLTAAERLLGQAIVSAGNNVVPIPAAFLLEVRVRSGSLARLLGRLLQAEQLLKEALQTYECLPDATPDQIAHVCNELGLLHLRAHQFDQAGVHLLRSLTLLESAHGRGALPLAPVCHNLGRLAAARSDPHGAYEAFARGLHIRERVLGHDHLATAVDRVSVADALSRLHREEEAEAQLHQALTTLRRIRGPEHYEVAAVLNNLGGIALRLGRHQVAERYFNQALAIKTALYGPDHPDLARPLVNLALARCGQGRVGDAVALYERARDLLAGSVGPGHPLLRKIEEALRGTAATARSRPSEAAPQGAAPRSASARSADRSSAAVRRTTTRGAESGS